MVYMPRVMLRHEHAIAQAMGEIQPEDKMLWFPSDLTPSVCKVLCLASLSHKEEVLREAQCWDALASICSLLRAEAAVHDFHNKTARGQSTLTRMADILEGWKAKRSVDVKKYRKAWQALLSLRGVGDWMDHLWELKNTNMASMYGSMLDVSKVVSQASLVRCKKKQKVTADATKDMPKDISWIWLSEGSPTTYDETMSLEGMFECLFNHKWHLMLDQMCTFTGYEAELDYDAGKKNKNSCMRRRGGFW